MGASCACYCNPYCGCACHAMTMQERIKSPPIADIIRAAVAEERDTALLQVNELLKKLGFMAELGRRSMENFDDDLEERPMRHSLGALHRQWEVVLGNEKLGCEESSSPTDPTDGG